MLPPYLRVRLRKIASAIFFEKQIVRYELCLPNYSNEVQSGHGFVGRVVGTSDDAWGCKSLPTRYEAHRCLRIDVPRSGRLLKIRRENFSGHGVMLILPRLRQDALVKDRGQGITVRFMEIC